PYIPQYQEIQKTSNTEGFSTRVCLVLLIANILRIFFWVGKQFELTLLVQSVVMILTMLAMLHLCCTVQISNRVSTKQHRITEPWHMWCADLDVRYFWRWSAFEDYLLFCFGFTMLCAFFTLFFLNWVVFVESLGSMALLFEAMLGLPQLLQNYNNGSTRGMSDTGQLISSPAISKAQNALSIKMVLLWTAGDIFKTTYFMINESPAQFWLCGMTQILIDIAILVQVGYYGLDSRAKVG
ncbi:hypothetical protein QTP86_019248, partial [Hemibagrus guttatus]